MTTEKDPQDLHKPLGFTSRRFWGAVDIGEPIPGNELVVPPFHIHLDPHLRLPVEKLYQLKYSMMVYVGGQDYLIVMGYATHSQLRLDPIHLTYKVTDHMIPFNGARPYVEEPFTGLPPVLAGFTPIRTGGK